MVDVPEEVMRSVILSKRPLRLAGRHLRPSSPWPEGVSEIIGRRVFGTSAELLPYSTIFQRRSQAAGTVHF